MEVKHYTINLPKRHRKPDKHRRNEPTIWRWFLEFVVALFLFLFLISTAEAICAAFGCPADGWPWF